ncbi:MULTISPECIES: WXG100 family type VII secretion target [Streptomyces]|uniref:WXG100 family type VII secretion target n=1 Tax=Streptomyces TaxID=1883 RepID=UPI0023DD145A|nr:WXG100 family type VII secretion target [Streptomyces sp. FXJ1.172]WEP00622.1 WXG100 family type VII secretion target [Streptomyces sp. FXJ1.172]
MKKYLSAAEFEVALHELEAAIGTVGAERDNIAGLLGEIGRAFSAAESSWESPSATTFAQTQQWFTRSSNELHDLLAEMVRRMEVAYRNYLDTEIQNHANVTPNGSGGKGQGGHTPNGADGYDRAANLGNGHKPAPGSGNGSQPAATARVRPGNSGAAGDVPGSPIVGSAS